MNTTTEHKALAAYEIAFTGRQAGALGAFEEIRATRFAHSPEEAVRLLYEPLPVAFEHIARPQAREIPSPFCWRGLYNYVVNDRASLERFAHYSRMMVLEISRAAAAVAKAGAEWHDDPESADHGLYHAPAEQKFPAEVQLIAAAEIITHLLRETPAGLRTGNRLILSDDDDARPTSARVELETMEDDHGTPCTEARLLPTGDGGNAIVGIESYRREMAFRRTRNKELEPAAQFPLPAWRKLKVYWSAEAKAAEGGA